MIGTFDTKEAEFAYLRERLMERGHRVLSVNAGVMGSPSLWSADIDADAVAKAGGSDLDTLRGGTNKNFAMEVMCRGAAATIRSLYEEGRFQGIIGMGGGGGTSIVTAAMRALPLGLPKVCVSTVASGDVSSYVGTTDIVMFPSLVDIAGINRLSRVVMAQAAGAISGMVGARVPSSSGKNAPTVAATMFGNTTPCVQVCAELLRANGFEVLIFHATGAGGRMMEQLIDQGFIDAVLDITTTELADEACGGIMSAGDTRLTAAARRGIPQVVAPGCLDMVNFGPRSSVPVQYSRQRTLYEWNPHNTLMRTNIEENRLIGKRMCQRLNESTGPVSVLLPARGLSMLGEEGQPFFDPEADAALFDTIKKELRPDIELVELDTTINDPAFAKVAVERLIKLIRRSNDGHSTP